MWSDLEPIGRSGETGGYRRHAWTRVDHDLREWFVSECAARGLEVTEDRAGNQWAWWGDPDATPGVVIGSHLDSVPDGGAFDGPLGVVSALAVVDELRSAGVTPDVPLGIASFVDEEGARFGVACAGSRIITGVLAADRARSLTDADGTSMAEAWRAAGRDPEAMGADEEALRRVGCFVELHVEQGKALALDPDGGDDLTDDRRAVAVGTDIWPHGRWRIEIPGEANHAGTTRLEDRRDAMLGARDGGARCPVPGRRPRLRRDRRQGAGEARRGQRHREPRHRLARRPRGRRVRCATDGLARSPTWQAGSAPRSRRSRGPRRRGSTRALVSRLSGILPEAPLLGTGAGHDAGILAGHGIPTAMLFVRNPTGVSHSPAEWAEADDCHAGVDALAGRRHRPVQRRERR